MALSRAKKTEKVKQLASELESSTSAIIGTFSAMTASKDFDLRKIVRAAGGSYHVVKNKLAAKASQGTRIEGALQGLKGVSSVAYTSGDPVALAKALSAWVKDNAEFTFKLGIVDGKVITVEEVNALATMPGKEELYAKLLFLIQSPAQRLATVINATGRDLAVVINQGVEKEKFSAGPAPAAAAPAQAPEAEAAPAPADLAPPDLAPADLAPAAPAPADAAPAPSPADGALIAEVHATEAPAAESPATESPTAEAPAADTAAPDAPAPDAATPDQAGTPTEQIAANPASEADPVAETQPENGTGSEVGEAASTEPVEG